MAKVLLECPNCGIETDHQHIAVYDDLKLSQPNVTCLRCSQGRQHTFPKPKAKSTKKSE